MNGTPAEILDWGQAIPSQSIADAATVNGSRIVYPASIGKHLVVLANVKPAASVTGVTIKIQGSNDSGTTWTTLKQNDGATDLAFTAADFAKTTGKYDSVPAMGSIDVTRAKYRDFRVVATSTGAASVVSVTYLILPVERQATKVTYPASQNAYGQSLPSGGNTDEWLNKFLPTGS